MGPTLDRPPRADAMSHRAGRPRRRGLLRLYIRSGVYNSVLVDETDTAVLHAASEKCAMKFGRQVAPSDVVNYFALVLSEAMPFGGRRAHRIKPQERPMEVLLRSGALVKSDKQEGELYQSPGDDFAVLILADMRRPFVLEELEEDLFRVPRAAVEVARSLLHGSDPSVQPPHAAAPRLSRAFSAGDGRAAANGGLSDSDVISVLSLPTPRDLLFTWSSTSTQGGRGLAAPGDVRVGVATGGSSVTAPGSRAARAARNHLVSRGMRDVRVAAGQPTAQETPLLLFGELFVQCAEDPAIWRARFAILKADHLILMPTASLDDAVMCAQWHHEVQAVTERAASSSRALASAAVAAAGGLNAAVDAGPRHVIDGDSAPPSPRSRLRAEEGRTAASHPVATPLADAALEEETAAADAEPALESPAPRPAPTPAQTPTPEGEAELSAEKGEEAEAEPSPLLRTPPRRRRRAGSASVGDRPVSWRSTSSAGPRAAAAASPQARPYSVAAASRLSPTRTPRRVGVRRGCMPRYPTPGGEGATAGSEPGAEEEEEEEEWEAVVRAALDRVRARVDACACRPALRPIATSVSALPASSAAPAANASAPPYLASAVDVLPLENCDVTLHRAYEATPNIRVDRPVLELAQARRTLRIRAHSSPELEVWRVGLSRNAAACSSVNYMRLSDVMIGDEERGAAMRMIKAYHRAYDRARAARTSTSTSPSASPSTASLSGAQTLQRSRRSQSQRAPRRERSRSGHGGLRHSLATRLRSHHTSIPLSGLALIHPVESMP